MLKIIDLQTEHTYRPSTVDNKHPRFSWKLSSDNENVIQHTYQIIVSKDSTGKEVVWDSGIVSSAQSLNVIYEGLDVDNNTKYFWSVKVSDGNEEAEASTFFETGIFNSSAWEAKWIQPVTIEEDPDAYHPVSYLRKLFTIKENVKRARIFQTAHGLYEFWINNQIGTEDAFKPGFTSYYKRLQYQAYEITDLLTTGENVWSVILSDGWWKGMTGGLYRNNFGYKLQFLGQILVEYNDGTTEIIVSDDTFVTRQGAFTMSDMQFGTVYDANLEPNGWKTVDFDDSSWGNVALADDKHTKYDNLIATRSVPVREKERFEAKVLTDEAGNTVLDFGQNIAGYVEMTLRNPSKGQRVSLEHSEDMKDGIFDNGNITDSITFKTTEHYQQVDYIAEGKALEIFKPIFSVFGFRYAKLEGYDSSKIQDGDFVAIAVYSDLDSTGNFECSNTLINQLVSNSRWSQKGNFLDVPTDCPTRERSPWTGDSQVYAKTASLFMDVYPFYEKWLQEIKAEQFENGMIGATVPSTNTTIHNPVEVRRLEAEGKMAIIPAGISGPSMEKPGLFDGSTGWGDTAVISPYTMYICYGDKQILKNQYDSAKKWVEYMINSAKDENPDCLDRPEYHNYTDGKRDANYIFDTRFHYGEWLEPVSEESGSNEDFDPEKEKGKTNALVASAYLFYSSHLLAEMADILGETEDAKYYEEYSQHVRTIYNKYFIQPDGTMIEGKQAPYVRVLQFNLVDDDRKELVANKLIEEVRNNGMKLSTGFLSTPFLLFQLLENGFKEEAFELLEQTESPSWLFPVTLGATTILEDWTGLETHTNSYNHYSYGAVCDFLFSAVTGIKPLKDTPGYKKFELKPTIGGSLEFAKFSFDSPYGQIQSEWKKAGDIVEFTFEIPANTNAEIILPNGFSEERGSGTYHYQVLANEC